MEAEYNRRIMALSPGRRMAMACEMFGTAKTLARARLRAEGVRDEAEMRCRMFLRFYGDDFSEAEKSKILAHLRKTTP